VTDNLLDAASEPPAQGGDHRLLAELTAELAREESGLGFVYRLLDIVVARYHLDDLIAVVESPHAARQVFRAGRRGWRAGADERARRLAVVGQGGLHATPPAIDAATSGQLSSLIELALRLDLLRHDASHDALTGLMNRRSYELMLNQAVSRSQRYGWPFALMILDLNGFKKLNDRMGHAAGDATLRAVGVELRHTLRAGDVAARIGGDEFALLLANGGPEVMRPLLDRLEEAVNAVVPGAGTSFAAGLARFPDEASDADELARIADQRLYAAKAR
jgi:diguanylate cyclase (GGDEF)-like protein